MELANERLKRLREETKLSNRKFAESLDVSEAVMSSYFWGSEKCRKISEKFNKKVRKIYGVDLFSFNSDAVEPTSYIALFNSTYEFNEAITESARGSLVIPVLTSLIKEYRPDSLRAFYYVTKNSNEIYDIKFEDIVIYQPFALDKTIIDGSYVIFRKDFLEVASVRCEGNIFAIYKDTEKLQAINRNTIIGKVIVTMQQK
jgi:DNA-binding XRE family transcriptional regulator